MSDCHECFVDLNRMLGNVGFVAMQAMTDREARFLLEGGRQVRLLGSHRAELCDKAAVEVPMVGNHPR